MKEIKIFMMYLKELWEDAHMNVPQFIDLFRY